MEALTNFFTSMSKQNKLLLAFCVSVILCTLYRDCFLCKYIPKLDGFRMTAPIKIEKFKVENDGMEEDSEENFENVENTSNPSMVLFYAPWCPHCKSMMGDWDKLRNKVQNKLKVMKVNCDEKPEIAEKHAINGFPTIILFKNGKKIQFEGPRKFQNFMKFVEEHESL